MKWDHVRVFLAVARHNKLSQAGKHLGLDTSTVGRHIDQLEKDLSTRLFHIADQVGDQSDSITGAVRIGASEDVANYVMAPIASDFCEQNPKLQLQLVSLPRIFSLSKREADIAITVSPPESGRLKVQKIADYDLFMYTTDLATERFGEITDIGSLKNVRGIGYIPDLIHDNALNYIPLISPNVTPHLTSSSILLQTQWARIGAGVVILPSFIAKAHPELKPILTDKIHFQRAFYMLQHQDMAGITRVKKAVEFFVERMRSQLKAV